MWWWLLHSRPFKVPFFYCASKTKLPLLLLLNHNIFSPGRFALAVNLVMLFSADRCCYGPVATSVVGRSNQSDYHLTAREIRKRASCCCTTRPIVFQMVHFRKLNCQQPMKQFQVDLGYDMSEIKKLPQKMQWKNRPGRGQQDFFTNNHYVLPR